MNESTMIPQHAFAEVRASSAGGALFLTAYKGAFLLAGILSCMLPAETAALLNAAQPVMHIRNAGH